VVPSEDGTAAIGVVPVDGAGATEIAESVRDLRDALDASVPEGVTAEVTGPAAIQADLAAVFEGADFRLLGATATVVAILLVLTYRSPVLWLIPLSVVAIADRTAVAVSTHVLDAFGVVWDESTVGILSVLVFGAGTDYALLLISRYRDELRRTEDRYAAMRTTVRRTVEPVLASASTVVIGLLILLLSVFPTTRGLGLACAVGVVVAAVAALVFLPFTLVLVGRWVFWPRVPHVGDTALVDSRSLWRWVGDRVSRRPVLLASVTTVVLLVMALGTFRIDTGLSQADQFLDTPEAISAGERLAESFPAGSSDPTVVLTEAAPETVSTEVESVEGVAEVRPGGSADGVTRLDVVLEAEPGSEEAGATIESMRAALGDQALVGGTEAERVDEQAASERDRLLLIPLILVLVLLALAALLRSVVAPVILVISVVGTYFAALGASWVLFTEVFGFEALDVGVPLLAFLFLVALGVDYNIFLVTRAGEEGAEHGARRGMLRALTATGGVITSAGIVLAAVFAVLGVLPLVVLAQLGVVICVGVLLDTLVVRTVLVPAIAVKMGDPFWWPRRLSDSPGTRGNDTTPEAGVTDGSPTRV
jgi:RND superfamily putative drug exporter